MKKSTKKGFTLVELVIVIAIIAILAAVLIPTFSGIVQKANASAVRQAARNAYTEYLALDLADGKLDKHDGTSELALPTNVTTITVNSAGTDYASFVYTDSTKGYTATYTGSWSVDPITTP